MNLKVQHIGRLFTFLAGLIILAHTVVPHHHHFELTHSSEQESSCESSAQDKNTENPDSHCHSFNILIVEKTTNPSSNKSLSDHSGFYLAVIFDNNDLLHVKNVTETFYGQQSIFLKQFLFTPQSPRAPPANA